ncbi:hypothetical protein D187_006218 [Cystobacter fuscus DSM 2262]|uniref:Uncharacterized protein n=1 Tax=Cystobacter fuscus (strain ATCC 25194 / DSM 2262 / NBRC 100088 / M29) TaxID=1242864 RepID=S9R1N8_CYSF2|nr:hypothetical protein D187_006218 [Cystobacter fuscus DSM 2262]
MDAAPGIGAEHARKWTGPAFIPGDGRTAVAHPYAEIDFDYRFQLGRGASPRRRGRGCAGWDGFSGCS